MKKIILFSVVGLVLIAASIVGTLFFAGAFNSSTPELAAGKPTKKKEVDHMKTEYFEFDPEFTINFAEGGGPSFLQINVVAAAQDPEVIEAMELHMPAIRNDLLLLMSAQDGSGLVSREGKEALRTQIREAIQEPIQQIVDAVRRALEITPPELASLAHYLKGVAGSVGFDEFTEPSRSLEGAARAGVPSEVDASLAALRALAARVVLPEAEPGPRAASA